MSPRIEAHRSNGNKDLKLFMDKEVSCVDFSIDHGKPGLALELNSGEHLWTPVCVKKPHIEKGESDFLSVQDLIDMDEVVFLISMTLQELS